MEIFTSVDDIGLLNLANISYRFDGFAQIVFKKRYATKYFIIDNESEQQQEIYREQFSRFGQSIKAIEVNNIRDIDGNHWMAQMLTEYTNGLEKLAFNGCTFKNATEMFAQHLNLTHLTLQKNLHGSDNNFEFPSYRNLKSLKLCNFANIPLQTVQQIARNNPQMERLNIRYCEHFTLPEIMKLIANHLKHLKYLALLDDHDFDNFPPAECSIERFVNSVGHLESLALIVDNDVNELLRYLGQKCKAIKQLELCHLRFNMETEMIASILTFQNVESLNVTQATYDDKFETLIEHLPNLRRLLIDMYKPHDNAYILSMLRKSTMLERLTLIFDYDRDEFAPFVNTQFYNEFLEIVENRPVVRIVFQEYGETICYVTNTEIFWRKKLMHWIGYDPIHSRSDVQLLDLATPLPAKSQFDQQQDPFDLILEYLDLGSLYAFYRTNKKCKEMIDAFVRKRSQSGQRFVCTDEFHSNLNELCPFGPYVNNLEVKLIYYWNLEILRPVVEQSYRNLKVLYFRSNLETSPQDFIVPQIRNFVFNSSGFRNSCNLNEILRICQDLETIEIINEVEFPEDNDENIVRPFCNLKKFTFKPTDETQLEFLREYFLNKQVEVITKT